PGGVPGLWKQELIPSVGESKVLLRIGGDARQITVEPALVSQIHAPISVDSWVDQPLRFQVGGIPSERLAVVLPEGKLTSVETKSDGLQLELELGPSEEARVIQIGLYDLSEPQAEVVWVLARIARRAEISLATEPGSKVSVEVEGRVFGPVTAGPERKVSLSVPVLPGQVEAKAISEDSAGNRSATTITLALSPQPSLGLMVLPGPQGVARLALRASNARGKAWTGPDPTCVVNPGLGLELILLRPGEWTAALPSQTAQTVDLRVSCQLEEQAVTVSQRSAAGVPSRIVLRAWPEELSSDFPVSQIQASLEDARGERLPPQGLSLKAAFGTVSSPVVEDRMLRADYLGRAEEPLDTVQAQWTEPPSSQPVERLSIELARRGEQGEVVVRALDSRGKPVQGAEVVLWLDDQRLAARSDTRGRARLRFDSEDRVTPLRVQSGEHWAEGLYLPWVDYPVIGELGPDLVAESTVSIRAGRVRKAELSVDREVLYASRAATATVVVVLLDRGGVPVVDEQVRLSASEGFVSELIPQADGSLQGVYQAPPGLRAGEVQVRLDPLDGTFEAKEVTLEIRPPPITRSPGLAVGVLANTTGLLGPFGSLSWESALASPSVFSLRLELGVYRLNRDLNLSSGSVSLGMEVLPITLSGHRRWNSGLWSSWVGGGVVAAPYRSRSWFVEDGVEQEGRTQIGIHGPGLQLYGGRGFRVRGGEAFGELRYLALGSRADEISGQVGGVTGTLGFRIVY
ncbi:MAG: hypothetical protein ACI9VR_003843, partial [Cognaticolwellia sp.]